MNQAVYKRIGSAELHLDVFQPAEPSSGGPRAAAVVFFFGGGWNGGTPGQFHPHCAYLASRGMVAMAADYRVHSRNGTSPFECVCDGRSAIRWIRSHAGLLGIDPNRLAAGGGSAGAQVAAACALTQGFDEPDEDPGVSPRPDALILFNPVIDNGPDGYGYDRVQSRWREFSPLHNVRPGAPPTAFFLGSADTLIPVSTACRFQDLMREAGSRCDLHVYAGQPHGFFNFRDGMNPCYFATVRAMDEFLSSVGFLAGPPTIPPQAVEASRIGEPAP
jgi:acetyl esterase